MQRDSQFRNISSSHGTGNSSTNATTAQLQHHATGSRTALVGLSRAKQQQQQQQTRRLVGTTAQLPKATTPSAKNHIGRQSSLRGALQQHEYLHDEDLIAFLRPVHNDSLVFVDEVVEQQPLSSSTWVVSQMQQLRHHHGGGEESQLTNSAPPQPMLASSLTAGGWASNVSLTDPPRRATIGSATEGVRRAVTPQDVVPQRSVGHHQVRASSVMEVVNSRGGGGGGNESSGNVTNHNDDSLIGVRPGRLRSEVKRQRNSDDTPTTTSSMALQPQQHSHNTRGRAPSITNGTPRSFDMSTLAHNDRTIISASSAMTSDGKKTTTAMQNLLQRVSSATSSRASAPDGEGRAVSPILPTISPQEEPSPAQLSSSTRPSSGIASPFVMPHTDVPGASTRVRQRSSSPRSIEPPPAMKGGLGSKAQQTPYDVEAFSRDIRHGGGSAVEKGRLSPTDPPPARKAQRGERPLSRGVGEASMPSMPNKGDRSPAALPPLEPNSLSLPQSHTLLHETSESREDVGWSRIISAIGGSSHTAAAAVVGAGGGGTGVQRIDTRPLEDVRLAAESINPFLLKTISRSLAPISATEALRIAMGGGSSGQQHHHMLLQQQQQQQSYVSSSDHLQQQQQPHSASPATLMSSSASSTTTALNISGGVAPAVERPRASSITQVGVAKRARSPPSASDNVRHAQRRDDENAAAPATSSSPLALLEQQEHTVPSPRMSKNCTPTTTTSPGLAGAPLSADTSAPFQPYPLSHESSSSPVPQSSSSQPQSVAALTPEPTPTGAATQGLFERSNHVGGSVVGAMSVPSVNMKTLHAQQQQQQQHDTVASHSSVALLNVSNARSASLVSPGRKTSTGGGAATQHQPLRSPRLSVSTNPTQHLPSPRNSAIVEQILQLSARRESEAQHAALHPAALPADNPAYRTTRIVPLPNIAVTTGIPPAALKKMRERAYASCNRSASIDDHEADITAAFHRDLRRHGGNVPLAFTMDDDEGSSNHAAARLVLGRVLDHLYATTPTTSIVEQKQHHDSEQHHPLNTFDHPVTTVDEGGHIDDDPTMPTAAGPNAVARTNSVSINRTSTMPFFDRTGGAMPSGSLSALLEVDDDEENEQVNTTTTFMKPHSNVAKDIHVGDNEEDCITVGMKTRPSSAAAMLNDTSSILKTAVAVPTTNSKKPGLSVMIDHQDQQQVVAPSRQKQLLPTSSTSSSSAREELPPPQRPVHHPTLTSSSAEDAAARNDASLFTIVFTEPSKACFSMDDDDDDDNNNNDVKRQHEDGEQCPFSSSSPPSSSVPPPQHDEDADAMFEAASKRRQSLPRLHIPGVSAASPPTEELMSLTASQNHNTHLGSIDSAAEAPRLVVDVTSGSATAAQAGQAALSSIRTPRKGTVNAATTSAVTRSPRRASLASPRATSAVTPTATVVASGGRTPRRASMGTSLLASSNNATPTTGGSTAAKSPRPGSGGKASGVVSASNKRGAQQRPATSDGSSLPPTPSGNALPVNVATSFSSPPPISLTPPTGHDNIAESEQTPATTGPAAKVKPAKSPRAGSAGSSRTAAVATSVSPTPTTRVSSGKTRSGSVAKKGRRPSSADGTKPESREGSGSRGGDAEVDDDDEEDIRPDSEDRSSSLAAAPHGGNSDYAAQSFDLLAFDTPQEVALRPALRGGGGDDHHHPLLAGANVPNKPRPTPRGKQSSSSGGGGGVTPRVSLGVTKSSKTGGGGGVQRSKSPRVPADTQAAKAAKAQEDEERLDDGSAVKVQQMSDSDADDDDDSAAGPLQTSRDPIATMLLAKQKSATMEDLDAKMKLRRSIIKRLAGILHKDLRTAAMHVVAKQQQQRKEGESPRGAGLSITSAAAAMMGSSGSTLPPDDNASVMSVGALSSVASPLMPLKSPLAGGASSLRGPASPYANSSSNHNNNGGEREFRAPPKIRVAVVISISQYKDNKIPRNQQCEFEASAMASTLASMGFVVTRMSMLSNQEDLRPTSKEVVLKCIKASTKPCKIGADFASIVYVCGGGFIGPLTGANQGNNPQPVNLRHAPKPLTEHLPPAAGSTAFVVVPGDVTFSLLARDTVLTLSDLQSIPSCTDGTNSWVLMDTYSISFLPPCPPNLNGFAMVGGRKTIGGELFCLYEMQHLFPLSLYCLRAISGWATRDSRLSVNAINAYVHGHLTRRGLFATTTASPFFVGDLDLATVHELRFCRQQVKDIRNVLHGKYTTVSLTLIPTRNQDPTSAEFVRHLRTAFLELLASDATNPMVRCLHRVYEPKLFAIMRGINPAKFVADDAALFRHMQAASRDLRERLQDPSVEYRVQAFGSMLLGEITMSNAYSRDAFLLTLENSKRIRQVKELKKEWLVKVEEMRAKRKQLHEQQEAALKLQEEEASMKQLQQQQSPLLNATVGSALGMTQSSSEPNPSFASAAGGSIVDADSVASGSIRRTSTPTVPPTASTPTPITPRPGSQQQQQQRGFARNPAAAPPTPTAAVVAPHTTTITTTTASDDHHVPRVIMTSGNMFNINAAIQLASLQQAKPDVSRAAGYFSNPIDNGFTIDGKAVHELGLLCCTTFLTTEFLAMKLDRAIRSHGLLSHDFIVKDVRIVPMDEDHVQLYLLISEIQAQWRGRVTRRKMSVLLPTVRDEVARREKIVKEEHDFILKINATLVWSAQRIMVDAERTARGDLVEMQHQALTYMYMDRVALYQRIAYHWYSTIVAKVAAQEAVFRGEIVSRKNIVWPGILRLLFWRKYIRILRDDDKGRKKIEEQAETKIRNVASQFWKVERKRW